MPTGSREEVEAAARSLLGRGVAQVLVKLGAKGSLLVRGVHNADNYWSQSMGQGVGQGIGLCIGSWLNTKGLSDGEFVS